MAKETGGPAFPVLNDGHHMIVNMVAGQRLAEGMTLRDYFAAKAMQALIAKHGGYQDDNSCPFAIPAFSEGVPTVTEVAEYSYAAADAMLAERAA